MTTDTYNPDYTLTVPAIYGLASLFRLAREMDAEMGLQPDDADDAVIRGLDTARQVVIWLRYVPSDAQLVMSGKMTDDEYIRRHRCLPDP